MPTKWPYVNARKAQAKSEQTIARLQARIERLEGQVRDLGGEPEP